MLLQENDGVCVSYERRIQLKLVVTYFYKFCLESYLTSNNELSTHNLRKSTPYRVEQKTRGLHEKGTKHDENIKIDHSDHERSEG